MNPVTTPMPPAATVTATPTAGTAPGLIPVPASLAATGVSPGLLTDLALRLILRDAQASTDSLARRMALPPALVEPLLAELRLNRALTVRRRGDFDGDISYELTDGGRLRAEQAMSRCQYVGPAPVSLDAYRQQVMLQAAQAPVTRERLAECLADMVVAPMLVSQLGAATNAGQPIYLFGPAGSGKSYLAEHLAGLMTGLIEIPYAIEVEGEIVQVFDPIVHRAVARGPHANARSDARWVSCRRPVVRVGGEFSVAMMDLAFDPQTRFYKAPIQVKANNGLLIVDDLGRQREPVEALLNRWIVPLERRIDCLRLANGVGFEVPFLQKTVFSSNLTPAQLGDPAFLRRLGYKLPVTSLPERDYLRVLQMACREFGVTCSSDGALHLIRTLHARSGIPTMAAYPRNLVAKIADRAAFENVTPVLSPELIDWAWQVEFASGAPGAR